MNGSDSMFLINAIITLKQNIKLGGKSINDCVKHCDVGSQYKTKAYKSILNKNQTKMSVADICLQNVMEELLNCIFKNDYIVKDNKNVYALNKQLGELKPLNNEEQQVKELQYKTPIEFEQWIENTINTIEIVLYDFTKSKSGSTSQGHDKKKCNKLN